MTKVLRHSPACVTASDLFGRGNEAASAVVEAAFGRHGDGLGLILVDLRGHELYGSYCELRSLCLAGASHLGECMDAEPSARRDLLTRLGLGSDVPLAKSKGSGAAAAPPANTFSATLQLRWDGDLPSYSSASCMLPATSPMTEARALHGGAGAAAEAATVPEFAISPAHGGAGAVAAPLPSLKASMEALGLLLSHVAAGVARACDAVLASRCGDTRAESSDAAVAAERMPPEADCGLPGPLESCLLRAGTAKARLIHYRSADAMTQGESAASAAAPSGSSRGATSKKGKAAAPHAFGCKVEKRAADEEGFATSASSSSHRLAGLGSWQHWHYDYGLLTALCAPGYRLPARACAGDTVCRAAGAIPDATSSDGCSRCAGAVDVTGDDGAAALLDGCDGAESAGLVVLAPAAAVRRATARLHLEAAGGAGSAAADEAADDAAADSDAASEAFVPVRIHIPPYCVAVQVGEAAQIISGGRLVATPHCVARPAMPVVAASAADAHRQTVLRQLSRQMFVVFLQPPWAEDLRPAAGLAAPGEGSGADTECPCERSKRGVLAGSEAATAVMGGIVPPLGLRWNPPCVCQGVAYDPSVCGAGAAATAKATFSFSDFSKATTAAFFGISGPQRVQNR